MKTRKLLKLLDENSVQDVVEYRRSQPYKTPEDCRFDAIITQRCHINTLGIIDEVLSKINDGGEIRGKFDQSCFSHFPFHADGPQYVLLWGVGS
ncbi:hypothetical protein ACOSQ2_019523 [Xanthoceras sorbifolium]